MPHLFCNRRWPAVLMLGALALPVAVQVQAQVAVPAPAESPVGASARWGVGLGVNLKRQAYEGIGTSTTVIPLISYENKWVRFAGPTVDFKVPVESQVSLALRARYAFEDGYQAADSTALFGMDERKSSLWLGAALSWRGKYANASGEWLMDASDHSGGKRARASIEKPLRLGAFLVTPRVALNWVDQDYVNYYYGVRPSETRAGRPEYGGDSALNPELGVRVAYRLSTSQSFYVDASVTHLDDAIGDSALVARNTESALRLGYLYQFR